MVKEFPLIFTEQYLREVKRWLDAIRRGESASIIFTPKNDRFIRIGQLLSDRKLLQNVFSGEKSRFLFQQILFGTHDVEDKKDLHHEIVNHLNLSQVSKQSRSFEQWISFIQKKKITLILVLPEAEKFLTPESKHILTLFSDFANSFRSFVRVLSFFEADITHPSLNNYLPSSSVLYPNIFRYPLYSDAHAQSFIQLLENYWLVKVDKKEAGIIVKGCGGHFWLIKEAVREIVKKGRWSPEGEGLVFRLRTLYNALLTSEQRVIEKVITGKKNFTDTEKHSLKHLKKMNVIDENNRCKIGLFRDFLLQRDDVGEKLVMKGNRIWLDNIPLDKFFSRKEYRALRSLLEKRGILVTRDQMAQRIWPIDTQKHYSDWAIDQIIARLRKRMVQLSISPTLIQSVRGKGYLLKL